MPRQDEAELAYDPFSPDPSPAYPALRAAEAPVHHYVGPEHSFYAASHYADVRTVLTDRRFSVRHGQMHTYSPGAGLTVDPPKHTVLRRLLNPLFRPDRVARLAGRMRAIAEELADAVADRGEADLYADFASDYAIRVAAETLGVEPSRKDDMRQWTFDFTVGYNLADKELENRGREAVYAYFAGLMTARRAMIAAGGEPPDDVVTALVTGTDPQGRPFSDEELLPNTILLLSGGIDTTTFLLTNCVYRLLADRSLWERVCAEPALIPVAIEESLRYDSPVFGTFRTNDEPVTLNGVDIPKDSKIQMLYPSANRDPAVFDDPDRFSLDRDPVRLRRDHLAFGGGDHVCIGSAVARLSGRIALEVLTSRLPGLELAGEPVRFVTAPGAITANNGYTKLPLRWPRG